MEEIHNLVNYLEFFYKAIDLVSLLINLFNHLFTSVWTYGHFRYNLSYNPMLFHFIVHVVPI